MLSSKGVERSYEKALYPSSSDAKMLKATAGAREMAQAVFVPEHEDLSLLPSSHGKEQDMCGYVFRSDYSGPNNLSRGSSL